MQENDNYLSVFSDLMIYTPNGYQPFFGLSKIFDKGLKLVFTDGTSASYSIDHRFVLEDGKEISVDSLFPGDVLFGKIIFKIYHINRTFIGPIGVRGSLYSTFNLDGTVNAVHHNCELLGSSTTLIPLAQLAKQNSVDPIRYEYSYSLAIWEEPEPGRIYVMGVDSATGTGRDFSAIQVLKVASNDRFEQVASYSADRTSPHEFAKIVWEVSKMYNEAKIIIENNGTGALIADEIWYDFGCTNIINTDSRGIGTRATSKSKMEACMMLQREFERGSIVLRDESTLRELRSFEEVSPNRFSAPIGQHDDLVSALYWAVYCLNQPELDIERLESTEETYNNNYRDDESVGPRILSDDDIWLM